MMGSGWGVRARASATFAAGAALLSAALAAGTYAVAHHYLLAQRTASAEHQTYANARLVKRELASPQTNVAEALASLIPASDTRSLLYRDGQWFSSSASVGGTSLPERLLATVRAGSPAEQRVLIASRPALAIGIPLPALGADPKGDWKSEVSLLVLDAMKETVETLGRKYGQNCIVWAEADAGPVPIFLR